MKRAVVGSENPVKIRAVVEALAEVFTEDWEVEGLKAPSGVSDQPMTSEETLKGAQNRVTSLMKQTQADLYVGLEGGIEYLSEDEVICFAWMVVSDGTKWGKAQSLGFMLPDEVVEKLNQGLELGDAADAVFETHNIKQQVGTIGILTDDIISRTEMYRPAVVSALIPFGVHKELYQ